LHAGRRLDRHLEPDRTAERIAGHVRAGAVQCGEQGQRVARELGHGVPGLGNVRSADAAQVIGDAAEMRRERRHLIAKCRVIHAVAGDEEQSWPLAGNLVVGPQAVGGHERHGSLPLCRGGTITP